MNHFKLITIFTALLVSLLGNLVQARVVQVVLTKRPSWNIGAQMRNDLITKLEVFNLDQAPHPMVEFWNYELSWIRDRLIDIRYVVEIGAWITESGEIYRGSLGHTPEYPLKSNSETLSEIDETLFFVNSKLRQDKETHRLQNFLSPKIRRLLFRQLNALPQLKVDELRATGWRAINRWINVLNQSFGFEYVKSPELLGSTYTLKNKANQLLIFKRNADLTAEQLETLFDALISGNNFIQTEIVGLLISPCRLIIHPELNFRIHVEH